MHYLELLERDAWDPKLIIGSCCSIPPCLEMLGELIKIFFLHSGKVKNSLKTVLVDHLTHVGIESDPLKSSTESVLSAGCHH